MILHRVFSEKYSLIRRSILWMLHSLEEYLKLRYERHVTEGHEMQHLLISLLLRTFSP
jgi:hypothetical protein